MTSEPPPLVSIVIKTLNEECRIRACIESALQALQDISGEVIVADSGSTDSTLTIAAAFPIKVVQLEDPSERRCGVGPQLGYQYAKGQYIYIIDGDMELNEGFIPKALKELAANNTLAGVAGLVEEQSTGSMQFRSRKARNHEGKAGPAQWLGMGGLYRREAIENVTYMSNKNLFAHEEQELGLRLIARGWNLERIDVDAVKHFGHTESTFPLLVKRWRSGYLFGAGQLLRSSFGKSYFWSAVRSNLHNIVALVLWLLLLAGIGTSSTSSALLKLWAAAFALVLLQRIVRHKNLEDAVSCMVVWHVNAIALAIGLFLPQKDACIPVKGKDLGPAIAGMPDNRNFHLAGIGVTDRTMLKK